jgi:hypothetical protein
MFYLARSSKNMIAVVGEGLDVPIATLLFEVVAPERQPYHLLMHPRVDQYYTKEQQAEMPAQIKDQISLWAVTRRLQS